MYIPSVFSPSGKQTTAKEEANGSTERTGELQCPRVTSGAPWRIQEQLGKFVEQDGCFLCRIGIDPLPSSYRAADSLSTFNRLLEKESEKRFFGGIAFGEASITQIEQRGLFLPLYTHHGRFAFEVSGLQFDALRAWGWLRNVLEIDWDMLEALHRRHCQSLKKYIVFPEPYGIITSEAFNGWQMQSLQSSLSRLLKEYALAMRSAAVAGPTEDTADRANSRYDSRMCFRQLKPFTNGEAQNRWAVDRLQVWQLNCRFVKALTLIFGNKSSHWLTARSPIFGFQEASNRKKTWALLRAQFRRRWSVRPRTV